MIDAIDLQSLARRLDLLESVAIIRRVASTNELGRRVIIECADGDLPLPRAVIIAREQTEGRGRDQRAWHSPKDKGIYATILHARPLKGVAVFPLEAAVAVATFLRETWRIDARLKWPNDILAGGRKIAGILVEGRNHDDDSYLAVGIGLNVMPLGNGAPPSATSVADSAASDRSVELASATEAFIEFVDRWLGEPVDGERTIERWKAMTIHARGDRVECRIGQTFVQGTWEDIDEQGRAVLRQGQQSVTIAAGDLNPLDEPR